jgi:ATP-dependent Clp protease adaptor protein ClpS
VIAHRAGARDAPPSRCDRGGGRAQGEPRVTEGAETKTRPTTEETTERHVALSPPWVTVLWNCDCHTFDEVAAQLVKAIGCSYDQGMAIAWEVHAHGKSVVRVGPRTECERVARILAEIGLRVTVAEA